MNYIKHKRKLLNVIGSENLMAGNSTWKISRRAGAVQRLLRKQVRNEKVFCHKDIRYSLFSYENMSSESAYSVMNRMEC